MVVPFSKKKKNRVSVNVKGYEIFSKFHQVSLILILELFKLLINTTTVQIRLECEY